VAHAFAAALRRLRKAAGLSQKQLAVAVGRTQGAIGHLETGRRGVKQSPDLVARLEQVLGVPSGTLAQYLPKEHPARRMAARAVPVVGVVAAGAGREEPAEPGEVLRANDWWAGCVAYRARGGSMQAEGILDGDYLIVRPATDEPPEVGTIVVAWLEGLGHVVKRLGPRGQLRSTNWSHQLTDADRVLGQLVGVVRVL
jgi:SOS-response transcriptional repressor LexA